MKSIRNNRIVVDLNKVQYAVLNYVNQYGIQRIRKPIIHSVRGVPARVEELALFLADYPDESGFDRAKRLNILDVWTPTLYLKLQANSCLTYTGDKALSLWKAWQAKQFGNKKKG